MDIIYRIRSRDGTARWIHNRGFPLRDEKGCVYRLGGMARDITELHQQSECLQEFLKVSRDLFVACRLDGTRILVSPSVQDILGVSPEEYLRGTFHDYIHPDDLPTALEVAERIRQGHTVLDQQVRYRHKDGSYRWLWWRGSRPSAEGIWFGVARDVTEQRLALEELQQLKRELEERVAAQTARLLDLNESLMAENLERLVTEAELRQTRDRCRTLLQAIPDPMLIVDYEGGIREFFLPRNDSRPEDQARFEGACLASVFGSCQAAVWLDYLKQARQSGAPQNFEQRLTVLSAPRDYEVCLVPTGADEAIAILHDVTNQREHEKQRQMLQAEMAHQGRLNTMGEMAAALAHELNQPLSAILGFAQGCLLRLRSGKLRPEEMRDAVEQIAVQASRTGEIIRRVRSFVRRPAPERSAIQLNQLIHNVLAMTRHSMNQYQIDVNLNLDENLPPVHADRLQLDQVVLNLVLNAIESLSSAATRNATVWIISRCVGSHGLQVTVQDNGPGFASSVTPRLFEPFFTTKPHGMGMGLVISRSIIEAHGGRIWATTEPNGGAAFHFYLPAMKEKPAS